MRTKESDRDARERHGISRDREIRDFVFVLPKGLHGRQNRNLFANTPGVAGLPAQVGDPGFFGILMDIQRQQGTMLPESINVNVSILSGEEWAGREISPVEIVTDLTVCTELVAVCAPSGLSEQPLPASIVRVVCSPNRCIDVKSFVEVSGI